MLKTSDDEIIADGDILIEFSVQDSCIEHYNIESQVTSTNAAENSD